MRIAIFNDSLSASYVIKRCIGVNATCYFNGIGKLTLILPQDMETDILRNIELNHVISLNQSFITGAEPAQGQEPSPTIVFYVITAVEYIDRDNTIIIRGDTVNSILNRRCIMNNGGIGGFIPENKFLITNVSSLFDLIHRCTDQIDNFYLADGTVQGNMAELRNYYRIPKFVFQCDADLTATIPAYAVPHAQLLDAIIPILHIMRYGHTVTGVQDGKLTFRLVKGVNRSASSSQSPVVFSDVRGSIKNFTYKKDLSVFYSDVEVFCTFPSNFTRQSGALVRAPEGVRDLPPPGSFGYAYVTYAETNLIDNNNDGAITTEEQSAQAVAAATETCKKREYRETFTCDIELNAGNTSEYTGYALGDIVTIWSARHGIQRDAVINGWQYTLDKSKETAKLIIGEPDVTYMENAKYANH